MEMILTGDVNLMNVTDPAVPFVLVRDEFRAAEIVFCNLECCLYQPRAAIPRNTKAFSQTLSWPARRCARLGSKQLGLPTT